MIIKLINNNTLQVDDFQFRCCIGKNGLIANKKKTEGDLSTPKGKFKLKKIFYRHDKIKLIETKLEKQKIYKNMGWCNDPKSNYYNKLINIKNSKFTFEKLYRRDDKYNIIIVIDYNLKKIIPGKGSAIFIHTTKNYKPTAGCIALKEKDLTILLKIIKKNSFINIS